MIWMERGGEKERVFVYLFWKIFETLRPYLKNSDDLVKTLAKDKTNQLSVLYFDEEAFNGNIMQH